MAITLRTLKGSALTHEELDANFTDITSSMLYSGSFAGTTLTLHSSGSDLSIDLSSIDTRNATGSLLTTGSVSDNVLTFTKGDGSTFDLTVDTGSDSNIYDVSLTDTLLDFRANGIAFGGEVDLAPLNSGNLVTGSVSSNTLTFTKGDGSTFDLTVDTGSAPSLTLQEVVDTGNISTTDIELTGSLDITGSIDAVGQSTFTSVNSFAAPLVAEAVAGSSFGTIFLRSSGTSGAIAQFHQNLVSINSGTTLGSLKFTQFTNTWGQIKVQATNTSQKSVISLTANGTSTPHIEIDGETDEVTINNKVLAPSLANTSKPNVVGYDTATGELTYYSTGSFGGTVNTGSFYVSSSIANGNTITFNQGDGTTESVAVDTSEYSVVYDIATKHTEGPGNSLTTTTLVGASTIAAGQTRKSIAIPEIASMVLGDEVFITATYVAGDTATPITVNATGQTGIPNSIDAQGSIEFGAGGVTLTSDTTFMYHIVYRV